MSPEEKRLESVVRRVTGEGPEASRKPKRQPLAVVRGGVAVPKSRDRRTDRKKLTRQQWRAEYGRALRADRGFQEAMKRLPPRHAALLVAWATNGNNIHRAAAAVGYTPKRAKEIESSPGFQEAQRYIDAFIPSEERQWLQLLPAARFTLRDLLKCPDPKVRYLAAKDIVDRGEGKAVTRVDMTIREDYPSISDAEMQLAFSIMQQFRKGFAEALGWIRAHPKQAQEWIEANVLPAEPQPSLISAEARGSAVIDADFELLPEDTPASDLQPERILRPLLGFVDDWCPELETQSSL